MSHQQFSNDTEVKLTHGHQTQPTTMRFVLDSGIDLETRNSRRPSPIHVSHPGEFTQIHSAEYRLPIL
jgi:hypothetical protein